MSSNEQMLALLADLIRTVPTFSHDKSVTPGDMRWLGRAAAALDASGATHALVAFRIEREKIGGIYFSQTKLVTPLHDAYARLELQSPAALQGAFIPPGESFMGFSALVRVVKSAERSLLLIDPYVNATLFTEIAPVAPEGVEFRCLTSKKYRNELVAASSKWMSTGENETRPVKVRFAPPKTLHDRWIIVDGQSIWSFSQSFKDIAVRSAASVTQDRTDLAANKMEYWQGAWTEAEPLGPST